MKLRKKAPPKATVKKTTKSELFQMRLDPMQRIYLDIASRNEKCSVSSVIENALKSHFSNYEVTISNNSDLAVPISSFVHEIYSEDVVTMFVNMALKGRRLLTEREEIIWEIICEEPCFWLPSKSGDAKPFIKLIQKFWSSLSLCDPYLLEDPLYRGVLKQQVKIFIEEENPKWEKLKVFLDLWEEIWPDTDLD